MSNLSVYKASAGSGKTFRLVLEYLKIIIRKPYNYRYILAVTFTNKATTEMKERILRDLNSLACKQNNTLLKILASETNLSETDITQNAANVLSRILHDYDRFSVSTIDSFFQGILRSFARENGLYGAYEVNLDAELLLNEACDRLMLDTEFDKDLRNWLLSMSEDNLQKNKKWEIHQQLFDLGKELFNDQCQSFLLANDDTFLGNQKINDLKKEVYAKINWFTARCVELSKNGFDILEKHELSVDDFKGKSSSFASIFNKLLNVDIKTEFNKTFLNAIDNVDNWSTKNSPKINQINDAYTNGLNDLLKEIFNHFEHHKHVYNTAVLIQRNLHSLGVLSILSKKIRQIGAETNTLLINESNMLLKGIIGNNDAPFIYEKTGNNYRHFMIDEFQDTSSTQWDNFRPLVENSLSSGNYCLVVGDVKQSIYRWRNSDWQLLNSQLEKQLSHFDIQQIYLDSNWRSCENVVQFNNQFFSAAGLFMQQNYSDAFSDSKNEKVLHNHYKTTITDAFADVEQKPASGKKGGYIQCCLFDNKNKEYENDTLDQLICDIQQIQNMGYKAKDIAILVRTGKQSRLIAETILSHKKSSSDYNFELVSEDSLYINSSAAVKMLAAFMQYIISPADKIIQATIIHEFSHKIFPHLIKNAATPPKFNSTKQAAHLFDNLYDDGLFFSEKIQDDYFPFFNKHEYKSLIQNWSNSNLNDLIEELVRRYHLNNLPGEQAAIQALKDVVDDFTRKEGSNLHKFVEWWNTNNHKVIIQSAGERDAIRILTIHKSKGLEFPFVLLPFCDGDFVRSSNGFTNKTLWCSSPDNIFNQYPILPVNYSSALANSLFANDYYHEKLLSFVDELNVLYVAFTRAEKGLFIYSKIQPQQKDSIESMINNVLTSRFASNHFVKKESDNLYVCGHIEASEKVLTSKQNEINLSVNQKTSNNVSDALKLRSNYEDFLSENAESKMTSINQGKIMHYMLSLINTFTDKDKALKRLLIDGIITDESAHTMAQKIDDIMNNPRVKLWFSGKYKVLNETTILSAGFGIHRPDRVMIDSDKAIVVDYKASSIVRKAHKKQVEQYVSLIKKMGYQTVEGYVWYLHSGVIKNIETDQFEN